MSLTRELLGGGDKTQQSSHGLHVALPDEIRDGKVTDVYFLRGREVLVAEGENPHVAAEVRAASLPADWPWAVFAGAEEALWLLQGHGVDVWTLPEGSVFFPEEPVLVVSGRYLDFGVLETALLGLICEATGIATVAARTKLAAQGRPVYSFGARRMHPAIAPMIERSAYVGGCDGVAAVKSAEVIGVEPIGTMAHAVLLMLGEERAWRAFDRVMDPRIPRVALVDTFRDEKFGALAAAEALGPRLAAVRLDTPSSRRGDFAAILREVRWELDERGFSDVKIFVSGGIDEEKILFLNRYADSYGVGTSISNAPVVDFALDIVEIEGEPKAKRGKLSGRKHLWGCPNCGERGIAPARSKLGGCPRCGHKVKSLLEQQLSGGERKGRVRSAQEVREHALRQVGTAPDPFAMIP
ncbi:MAG TPA: nicotinate phosphoribosyltransferase [Actinomycetota bacterium]|nr:nicotinate phosphoribosyltransferase [Actinomycetota bacterium]